LNILRAGALTLEPLCAGHAAEMFGVLADPAIYEFENEPPRSVASLQVRYEKLETRVSPEGDELWLNWAVRLPGGELAGFVQATVLGSAQAYVAYVLASRYWRRGIASSSVRAVLEDLEATYSIKEAFAVLKEANYRSVGLLAKLGFKSVEPHTPPPWPAEEGEITMRLQLGSTANAA
jgi:[ribosomal protein S5]-alanine N-acetyltransferase